jgi:hypothetical protein
MLMLDRLQMDTKVSGSGIAAIAQYTTLVHWLASFKVHQHSACSGARHAAALLNPAASGRHV